MTGSTVVYLRPRDRTEVQVPQAPRVMAAFAATLRRSPPRPTALTACIGYLQEPASRLLTRQMGLRALGNLRQSLFHAPGREPEMTLLWREALATACFAHEIAIRESFDAPLLTGAGLLHRAGEIAALRALAQAEIEVGQRLVGPVMQELLEARDDELLARVTRAWSLPGELRLLVMRWRAEQEQLRRSRAVDLLTLAQALATELVHAATCTPGLAGTAAEVLGFPEELVTGPRAMVGDLSQLLDALAPLPAER